MLLYQLSLIIMTKNLIVSLMATNISITFAFWNIRLSCFLKKKKLFECSPSLSLSARSRWMIRQYQVATYNLKCIHDRYVDNQAKPLFLLMGHWIIKGNNSQRSRTMKNADLFYDKYFSEWRVPSLDTTSVFGGPQLLSFYLPEHLYKIKSEHRADLYKI